MSIKFSKKKNKERKQHELNLLKKFRNIKHKLGKNSNNTRNKDLYREINEIKSIEIQEAEGAKIRSKAQWREEGETSRYFCSLEKKGEWRNL